MTWLIASLTLLVSSLTGLITAFLSLTGLIATLALLVSALTGLIATLTLTGLVSTLAPLCVAFEQSCAKTFRAEPALIIVMATVVLTFKRRTLDSMYTGTWCTSCFSLTARLCRLASPRTFLLCCFLLFLFVILDIHFLICFYVVKFLYMSMD